MTLANLIKYGVDTLSEAGNLDAVSDSKLFAMHLFNFNYTDLFMHMSEAVDESVVERYQEYIDRRCKHEPAQYIMGSTCFMGYDFYVMPGVLIPRPETELLVERAYELTKNKASVKVLDMCCGSGCIGIAYKLCRNQGQFISTEVTLADISDSALELSDKNNQRYGCGCRIIKTDLFSDIDGRYDIILSNPPYIRTADIENLAEEVKSHEPRLALDGMEDGLSFYKKIIKAAGDYLEEHGVIVFEIGYDQYNDVKELLLTGGFSDIQLSRDYAGLERIVSASVD